MSTNFPCKRLICLVLVLFMFMGMMPVNVHAASDSAVDAAIIFADLHTSSSDYKESTVKGIMTAFKNAGLPVSSVTSGGDAFSVNADSTKYTGDPTKITGYIQNVLGSVPVNYVWSDHDRYGTGINQKSRLVYGAGNDGVYGTADDGNYYIFLLSMGDLCTYDRYNAGFNYTASSNNRASKGFTATVPEAIANFKAAAATLSKDRPLLIVSHQPLFDNRNDNGWAEDWCDAINEVASDMDVAFFYGHNHKYDTGSDYYYAKGSTMAVATRKLTSGKDWNYDYQTNSGWQYNNDLASVNKVLNFTHMCAGYLAPSSTGSTSSTTREGTAVAVAIYDDSIRFTTYNSKGIFTGNYAVDKTIARDHASSEPELVVTGTSTYFVGEELDLSIISKTGSKTEDVTAKATVYGYDLNVAGDYTIQITYGDLVAEFAIQVREKSFRDAATGITAEVSVPGATGLTVSTLSSDHQAYLAVAALLSKSVAYDIQLANGMEAIISMPIPAGVADPVVYHVSDDGKTVTRMDVVQVGDTVSFVADRFSCYVIGQDDRAPEASDLVVGDAGYSFVEVTAGTLKDGYYQLQNNHTSKYLTSTKTSGKNRLNLDANGQNHVWYIKAVSGGYTVQYGGPNGQYLTFGHESAAMSNTPQTIQFLNTNGYWGIGATSGNPVPYLAREGTNSSSTSVHGYASNDYKYPGDVGMNWNLYERIENQTTYSVNASNVHHYLGQNDDQVQLTYGLLANGAAGNLPAGGRWSFSTYKDTDGIVKSISNNGVIAFNKVVGSCYVKIAYTWSEGTVYAFVKVIAEIDPNACNHEYTAVTVDATCTQDGSVTYTCACGDSYVEIIQATGHNYESVVTAPTCTKEGYTTYTCANCGDSYTADQIAANGHDHESVTLEATCTVNGSITYTCACGDTYTEVIEATGHAYEAVVTAPTCAEAGYTTYTCYCGDTYVADRVEAQGHKYESVTVEATCTQDGSVTYTCACGETYTEVIKATGHNYASVVTAPTCTEEGYTTYTCSNCGHSYQADKVAATGHSYKSQITAPTCAEVGYTTYTCACGDSYTADEVAALGHNYKSVVTAPTCIAEGYTTHTCSNCGDSYVDSKVAALGHAYKFVTVEATCTKDGSVTYTCSCGESYKEVIKALGHDYTAEVTAPTCTAEGYTTYICATCGHSKKADKVAALGHEYESVTVEATCTKDGSITYTCHCGNTYTEVIKATGHAYKAVVTAPTCTEAGYTTYTCNCGDTYVADEVKALGHEYESVTVAATCTEDGSVTYTCACGETYTEVIKAAGHSYASAVTAPTCTEAGYTTYTCSNCGHSYQADQVAAIGHTYKSAVTAPTCTAAGYTTYTCFCGHSYVGNKTNAQGHIYQAVVTEPTNDKGGYTTYTCICGDSYIGDETEALENSIVVGDAGYSYKKVTAGTLEDGYYQIQNNHTSKYLTGTKTNNQNRLNLDANGQNHVWYIKAVSGGYTVQYGGPNGQYLTFSHEKAAMSKNAQTIQFVNTNGYWGIGATSGNPVPFLAREGVNNNSTSVHGYASNDYKYPGDVGMDWNLYVRVENQTAYSINASDVHHILTDDSVQLQYALLANGAAANLPAGGSYSFQVSKDVSGIIAGITDQGLITFNNVAGSCYVKISFTWSEGSVYRYVKVTTELDPNRCDHAYTAQTVAPTCTEMGYTTYTCTVCGDSYVADEVAALGHDYKAITVPATCTADGSVTYTCACGDSYVEVIKATGHDHKAVTQEATCTVDGSVTYTCACGDTYVETIKATGHDYKAAVTAPTCTDGGYTTYTCHCGDTYVADEVLALGHQYESVTVEPTCTKYGTVTHICHCGDAYVAYTNATGHDYKSQVTAPTCTEDGYTTFTCSKCGNAYTAEQVAALGHSYQAVVTAPTCLAEGYTTYTCACGDTYVADQVAAAGHAHQAVVTAPTCTKAGYTTYICVCGDSYIQDEVAALGHDYKAVVTEPTYSKGGYTTYTCVCGSSYIGDETEALENSIVAGGTVYEEKTVYVRVDSFENGGKYILVGEDKVSGGNPIAYLNNSGKEGWEIVSINSGAVTANGTTYAKGYIELNNAKAVWTASGSASKGFTLTNNGRYIGGTDANTLKGGSGEAVKMVYDASAVRLKTASGTTRYLYYSTYGSENWKWATSIDSTSSSRKMWIYKEVTVQVPVSAPTTYTMSADDVYHILTNDSAQLQYALRADGVAADLPAGGSYSFQVIKDDNGIVDSISNKGLITFNNVAGSCYVKIAYTWSEGTVYRYVRVTTELDPERL